MSGKRLTESGKCLQTAIFIFNQIWISKLKIILGIHAKEVKVAILGGCKMASFELKWKINLILI